ncbi:hypothetical protein COLO4_34647 [Corchorus olitorius]|uniref:Bromo domain-containing protein n=1 Tax=Corchorus olitorius TaxID=93759 RepID=A0A1R3GK46_9ROSI|nr:hypothetical protein COLO4_34647 [Corchorus olitorius]
MYQKRRLGALGIEWKPPESENFAVGPDFSQDYPMPLPDLDAIADPLPQFLEVMDWEPENELQSDDNDSEYNVREEYAIGGRQGSLGSSSGDTSCSTEDSDIDDTHKDPLRRSKRKNQKAEASISKSSRPRRAAARSALHLFSKLSGTSTDLEDEDDSEADSSDSESMIRDSYGESDESDTSLPNKQIKYSKGKEVLLGESEDVANSNELPESHNAGNRRRLVLKLPGRDPNKLVPPDNSVGLFCKGSKEATEGGVQDISSLDLGCSSGDAIYSMVGRGTTGKYKIEDHLDLNGGYKNGAIKWGGVKARSSKRPRLGETMSLEACTRSRQCSDNHKERDNYGNGYVKPEKVCAIPSTPTEIQTCSNMNGKMLEKNIGNDREALDDAGKGEERSGPSKQTNYHESPVNSFAEDTPCPTVHLDGSDQPSEVKEGLTLGSTNFMLISERTTSNIGSPGLEVKLSEEDHMSSVSTALNDSSSDMRKNLVSGVNGSNDISLAHEGHGLQDSDAQVDRPISTAHDSMGLSQDSKKMYGVVYRRSKTQRDRLNSEGDGTRGESTSNGCNQNMSTVVDQNEGSMYGTNNKRSTRLKAGQALQLKDIETSTPGGSTNGSQHPSEECGSSSKTAVRSRSTRNRRSNKYFHDTSPIRKPHQPARKVSWLMLTAHEEGSRYIPQRGDEVAYLRQGGNMIRAVEFCIVEGLEYSTVPGSGESCCIMTLKFTDTFSSMFNRSFKLTLPEVTGFPDFIVERTRFESSMDRKWSCRDKCRVWWKDDTDDDGNWWDGRIVAVKPKYSEAPDSPWEIYSVQYKSEPNKPLLHSPWELFNAETQWEQPRIDSKIRDALLSVFVKLEKSSQKVKDQYAVNKLNQVSQKSNFKNRFPVPLSLDTIHLRLENNYYRSLEAVKHDIEVMLSNAESFFDRKTELTTKLRKLASLFNRTLSSSQPS